MHHSDRTFSTSREDRAVGVGQHLRDAVVVAQVDEQDAAVVAHPVHPPGQTHGLPTFEVVRSAQVWLR
jgi:hypothetical protein